MMPPSRLLVLVALFLSCTVPALRAAEPNAKKAPAPAPGGFQSRVFTDSAGKAHPFWVFVPGPAANPAGTRPPVMLFLHGSGERGTNALDPLLTGIAGAVWKRKAKFPFVVVIPQATPNGNWLVDGPDAQRALGMLRQIQQELSTDPARVVLTGLSMGGSGSWSIAAQNPSAWSAVVPLCGRGDPATAAKFAAAKVPVWSFCGDQDTPPPSRRIARWPPRSRPPASTRATPSIRACRIIAGIKPTQPTSCTRGC
jgi:predicted peptidase